MGFTTQDLLERMTTAYRFEKESPRSLPEGFELTTNRLIQPGDIDSSNVLKVHIEAHNKTRVEIDPNNGEIRFVNVTGGTRTLSISGFTEWTVDELDLDHIDLSLDDGTGLHFFAAGLVLIDDIQDRGSLSPSPPDLEGSGIHNLEEVNDDNWWIAATEEWSITNGDLSLPAGETVSLYYNDQGREDFLSHLVQLDHEDLRIGGGNIERFMRALRLGFTSWLERDKEILRENQAAVDRTGGSLEITAETWDVDRTEEDSDAHLRHRMQGEVACRIGKTTHTALEEFLEAAFRMDPGDARITPNEDPQDGSFVPRRIDVELTEEDYERVGFEAPFTRAVEITEEKIQCMTPAGVDANVIFLSGSEWDDGSVYSERTSDTQEEATYGT